MLAAGTGIASAVQPDTLYIPQRSITITGEAGKAKDLVAILYNRQNLHFSDPSAPRFLFFDREGKVAMGIGGYVKGTMQYDFGGAIDQGASFVTYDIPVPANPAMRNQFFANANQSTIFLQMIGRSERFGTYEVFVRTNFSGGGPTGYDLKLKMAYLRVGYVTAGLTNSVFVDGEAGTPTIDDQGPAGEMSAKNIQLQYMPKIGPLTLGVSAEMPSAGYREDKLVQEIKQRVPDIPAFIQYGWNGGKSHIRLSGLLRNLSYRDLNAGQNKFATGWAAQVSGLINVIPQLTLFYQGAYGRGYARYINDLADADVDLIPDASAPGKMKAPQMSNFEGGLQINATKNLFFAASYSEAHLYGQQILGPDAYKYGRYLSCTAFYNLGEDLRVGIEYLRGSRHNIDHSDGHANRLIGMIQLTF